MQAGTPDLRFNEFEEQFNKNGQAIGFRLPNNDFLFQYDDFGGWKDQKGNYYSKDGILQTNPQHQSQKNDDEDESDIDDEIVDEFEQMLMQEEQGVIRKQKSIKEKPKPTQNSKQFSYETAASTYLQKLNKKQSLRKGLSTEIFIYFKIKSSQFQRVKPQCEKKQDTAKRNQFVQKQIKVKLVEQRDKLIQSNKNWLQEKFLLESSGTSIDDGLYDRYWYGWVKVTHDKYFSTINELKKSKQFAILQVKTYFALISKFYLKTKMQKQIQELQQKLTGIKETDTVRITLNNLPQEFPLSLIFDFIQFCDGEMEDIIDVNILDNFSADLIAKKRTAEKIMNIEGYCHDEKQYVWLEVETLKASETLVNYTQGFNFEVQAPFKIPYAQIFDTMGLLQKYSQFQKVFTSLDKFRFVAHQSILKRILMFRGQSLNIVRVLRYIKEQQQKKNT